MIEIFHNAKCTKSRCSLAILQNSGKEFRIIKYLEDIPTYKELESIIKKLKIPPIDLVRKQEKIWKEHFSDKTLTDDQIINAMIANPILIERPIVINGKKAAIGRPPENIETII